MRLEQALVDLWMACVAVSLISVLLFVLLSTGASVKALADARRRAARLPARDLEQMSHGCSVGELDAIDQALDRIAAEDQGAHLGPRGR